MKATVSVIVPVYNTEAELPRCLDSVLAQTHTELEVVCVNDGSTDSSPSILALYAARDPRVKIVNRANGGLSAARNSGLDAVTGQYVMFVDSDDWIPADAVEKMLAAAFESGLPVIVSNGFAKNTLPPRKGHTDWRTVSPALAGFVGNRRIHSSVCNKLYHREVIGAQRFIEGIYFEDWPFNTELFADLPAFALIDEPMYVYTTDRASITRSSFGLRKARSYLVGIAHVKEALKGRDEYRLVLKRIAVAVKMLVGKSFKSGDAQVVRLVAAQDFSDCPLDLKTRFRLWRIRGWAKRLK